MGGWIKEKHLAIMLNAFWQLCKTAVITDLWHELEFTEPCVKYSWYT